MIRNYLTVALRHLSRHKGYAFINVLGLAVGLACCLLIVLFVRDELRYDDFHAHADRVYRIVSDWGDFSAPATNPPFVRHLQADYPAIEVAKLQRRGGLVRYDDQRFQEERIYFGNPAVFDVFTFPLERGDPEVVLERPFTVVLTTEMAAKYFPNEDPIGQMITVDNQFELEVTGLAEPVPENAHFHFDFLVSFASLDAAFNSSSSNSWGNNSIYTYLLLPEGMAPETLEAQFPAFIDRHAGDDWNGAEISLQALTDIHLYSHHNAELEPNGRAAYVWVFSVIAGFILLIACVNFMNLATARSAERAREVGVRKAIGAQRSQLIRQFITESTVLAFLALLLAVVFVALALPPFRALSGKTLTIGVLDDGFTLVALVGTTLVAGLLAGSYPAFVLSSFRPVTVLRSGMGGAGRGIWLRRGLVVFQFAISVALIVGTAVVYSQLSYLRSTSLGFDQAQVVTLPLPDSDLSPQQRVEAWRQEVTQVASVEAASVASTRLPSELLNGGTVRPVGSGLPFDSMASFRAVSVGPDFFEALGVEVVAGRTFSPSSDTTGFVLNRAAYEMLVRRLPQVPPHPESMIGRELEMQWASMRRGPLLGVVENMHLSTLHEAIEPVVFFQDPDWLSTLYVRVAPGTISDAMASIEATWQRVFPAWPFAYQFVDQAFDAQYRGEERLARIFLVFAGLAIVIACLGLFGLAAFMAERRTKEIGVRKALGASVTGIVALLSKEFAQLVLAAFVIATPIAYLAMQRWLQDFAYHVDLGMGLFLGAGALVLAIALLTVSAQSIRVALTDPAKALRTE